ncbi:hypothetical protein VZT92_021604 [Zoarces viviparus]
MGILRFSVGSSALCLLSQLVMMVSDKRLGLSLFSPPPGLRNKKTLGIVGTRGCKASSVTYWFPLAFWLSLLAALKLSLDSSLRTVGGEAEYFILVTESRTDP